MADDTTSKKPKDSPQKDEAEVTSKRKRRVLRPAAEPTTLRQQSEKAQAKSVAPRRGSRTGRIVAKPFVFVGRLIARIFRPLGKFRFFRALGYVFAPPYVRNSWKELRLVVWPDARQSRRLTFAVIVFSLIFGTIVAVVDFGLDKLFRALVLK